MKYEGKLYGKIAGRYIEVTDHISNEDLIERLKALIADCAAQADSFNARKMEISEAGSLAMATAYRNVIGILTGENVFVSEI